MIIALDDYSICIELILQSLYLRECYVLAKNVEFYMVHRIYIFGLQSLQHYE